METLLKISEAARLLGVQPQTLRAWDEQGKLIAIRTPGGQRSYRLSDIQKLTNVPSPTSEPISPGISPVG